MQIKKLEQAKQEPACLLPGELNQGSEIQLSKCDNEQLAQPIRMALMLTGIKKENMPSEMEKAIILQFVQRNYPDYSPGELSYAFEKAMARKFKDANVDHYQNFSCEYIGRVLSAYEKCSDYYSGRMWRPGEREYFRGEIQAAYARFQNKNNPHENYHQGMYVYMVKEELIAHLGRLGNRDYPRQRAIINFFSKCMRDGIEKIKFPQDIALLNSCHTI